MTGWKYIDQKSKNEAVIKVLREYNDTQRILQTTPVEVKQTFYELNPYIKENIENKKDIIYARYAQSLEYILWFLPAWEALSETEQTILSEYYLSGNKKSGAGIKLQYLLNYSDRQIERLREKAVFHLSFLLFG